MSTVVFTLAPCNAGVEILTCPTAITDWVRMHQKSFLPIEKIKFSAGPYCMTPTSPLPTRGPLAMPPVGPPADLLMTIECLPTI